MDTPKLIPAEPFVPKNRKEQLQYECVLLKVQMYQTKDVKRLEQLSEAIKERYVELALSYAPFDENNILESLNRVDSDWRWDVFEVICSKYELTPKAYNDALKEAWMYGKGTGRAIPYFFKADSKLLMTEEEQEYFNNLPDTVTLYRGCSVEELEGENSCFGISWTTSREIAEFFAFRADFEEPRMVVKASVPKAEIKTFINAREEFECIWLLCNEEDVEIVTTKPTDFFYDYMERKEQMDE